MLAASKFILKTLALLAVLVCLSTFQVVAQETVSNTQVSSETIKSRLQDVKADTTLGEQLRQQLTDDYQAALGYIETSASHSSKAEAFKQSLNSAQEEVTRNRDELNTVPPDASKVLDELPVDVSTRDLGQYLQSERARESAESAGFASLEQQITAESGRPDIARLKIQSLGETFDHLTASLSLANPQDEPALLSESRRWKLSTQAAAINAEISMLEQELLSQPIRVELLMTQRDLSSRTLKQIGANTLLLEQALADSRKSETEQIIAESAGTEVDRVGNHPAIVGLISQNQELSRELQSLTSNLAEIQTTSRLVSTKLKEIVQSFQTAKQRLEIAGLNKALGQVLHEQRRDLPDIDDYKSAIRKNEESITDAGLQDIRFATEWREMQDTTTYIANKMSAVPPSEQAALTPPITELVENRRLLLANTREANSNYLRALTELNFEQTSAEQVTADFDAFLVENLLWVRNKQTISISSLRQLPAEFRRTLNPKPWLESVQALFSIQGHAIWLWMAILFSLLLLWKKKMLLVWLRATSNEVGKPGKDSMAYTLRGLALTFLLTLPWPLLIFTAGWALAKQYQLSDSVQAIGESLQAITLALFYQRALRFLCIRGGLAEGHFKWSPVLTQQLVKQTRLLLLSFLLPMFVMVLAVKTMADIYGGELARVSFVLAIVGLGIFLVGLLKPNSGSVAKLNTQRGNTSRFSWLWLVLGAVTPLVFTVMSLAGYQYSAITLTVKLIKSMWLAFGLVIARELVRRWLLVLSGRLNLEAFREKREALRLAYEREASSDPEHEAVRLPPEELPLDVGSISVETGKLVSFVLLLIAFLGLRGIWASVMPALSIFNEITLWEFAEGVSGQEQLIAVTLADFALALVYLVITIFAARSIPSLLKAVLRYSSSVTPGSRVAFATLARYSIVIIGISMIASTIGWNWGKIQWLIAAMGVGIGFGLQEIIANFISGIIILVERPIRVGDLVTVGDASGTVSRLQIRATTITNFDRQELLVPNKEFITGRVLNWSLSDEVIRLKARVGVAYGTDIDKALELVRKIAREHPLILSDPPPLVTFTEFGDNSLDITARCFTKSLSKRRETISDLNLSINRSFKEAGIVIAFPQRDVHLNTTGPLDVRVQNTPTKPE